MKTKTKLSSLPKEQIEKLKVNKDNQIITEELGAEDQVGVVEATQEGLKYHLEGDDKIDLKLREIPNLRIQENLD